MLTLGAISLTTPLMLLGLGLLTLPIIAHLMNRHLRRQIVFPTIRLLRQSAATQSQIFRLRRLILLILRCLIVALIAWAFARPVWTNARDVSPNTSEGVGVVLLVDVSASTARQVNGTELFHSIRAAAQRTLNSLKAGVDQADIVLADSDPTALVGRLSPNFPALSNLLNNVQPSLERADFAAALALAGRILAVHTGPRQLVILSDLQKTNWNDIAQGGAAINQLLPPETHVTFVRLEQPAGENIGVTALRAFPTTAIVNHPIQLAAAVGNYTDRDVQVKVRGVVDETPLSAQTLSIPAFTQRSIAYETIIKRGGPHRVTFSIVGDAGGSLAADDHTHLALHVVDRFPVVLISDDVGNEPGSASFFITRALAPRGDEFDELHVRRIGSAAITPATLADAGAVFVSDIGLLGAEAIQAIVSYVRRGGGVIWFCGDGPLVANLTSIEKALGDAGTLPVRLGARREWNSRTPFHIADGQWNSRLLQAFDERSQIALSQIVFRRIWSVPETHPDARVILRFNDGSPALATSQFGAGQFVIANINPSVANSDLGRYGAFVALVQTLATQVQAQPLGERGQSPGEPLAFAPMIAAPGASLEVIDPAGERVETFDSHHDGEKWSISLPRPALAGIYELRSDGQPARFASLNLDPRESDLSTGNYTELAGLLVGEGHDLRIAEANQDGPMVRLRGNPLWNWFVAAAMVIIGIELALIGIWRR